METKRTHPGIGPINPNRPEWRTARERTADEAEALSPESIQMRRIVHRVATEQRQTPTVCDCLL